MRVIFRLLHDAYPMPRTGSSPHACGVLLKEMKGVQYTLKEIEYYGYQVYVRTKKSSGEQQTIPEMMLQRQRADAEASGGAGGAVEVMTKQVRCTIRSCCN